MSNFIKKISSLFVVIVLCLGFLPLARQSYALSIVSMAKADEQLVTPYAHIIDWRYKVIDDRVYRRLYNYSTGQWIGEWEPI